MSDTIKQTNTPFRIGSSLPERAGWSVEGMGLYCIAPSLTDARILAGYLNSAYNLGYLNGKLDLIEQICSTES